ncbi:MAG TPA: Fe-S cluster assembly protein SufD [Acidimicrobiales bacterium]|nr:Fe-S cluster assembly protein SufD [Acidimicrobiales bacterium]
MTTFTADAAAQLPGPAWLREQRIAAAERFAGASLPTETEEVWRYSRISELDLDAFAPLVDGPTTEDGIPDALQPLIDAVGERAGLLVLRNGRIAHRELDPDLEAKGVQLRVLDEGCMGSVATAADVFTDLATAFTADGALVRVPRGVVVPRPIVVLQWIDADGSAVFPRLVVQAGEASQVTVLDHLSSPAGVHALTAPVAELDVADAANLSYLNVQELGSSVWQVGYQASRVGRDATLDSSVVALGGDYARVRADSRLAGQGGSSNLLAVYFGDGRQMHDFRTMQDHEAPKTTSDLLFKGAVEDNAHSVYSGLIRVRKGAKGTNAFQTNRNLVLTEGAHADSVPNLEIEENDVSCSHASAVGPIDEEQRYYLEARGVPTDVANRLIVLGFFNEVIERTPIAGLQPRLRGLVAAKLGSSLAGGVTS